MTPAALPATLPATLPAALAARAEAEPDRLAVAGSGGRRLTFGGWHAGARAVAAGLAARGVPPGGRVVLRYGTESWTDFVVAYCGVLAAGAVAVPVSRHAPDALLRWILDDCAAVGLLHDDSAGDAGPGRWTGTVGSTTGRGAVDREITLAGDAQILYTSGTSGRPKGVTASHGNLAAALAHHPRRRPLAHSALFLHAFPVGSNAGQTMLCNALVAEPAALVADRFTGESFAALIETHRVGTVFVVPSMAIALLEAGAGDRHDLSSVQLFGCTAAALPPAVAERLRRAMPSATIVNTYTSTEAAPAQTTMVVDPARPGSVGRPDRPGQLRITGPDGAVLGPGEVGAVWLRTGAHTRGYLHERDGEVFAAGWTRMGDVGRLDADGYLYLEDRESDLVNSGGNRVSTLRVEAALHEHPGVVEAAAAGLPHDMLGSVVGAAVVAAPGLDPAALRGFLRQRLAGHEVPARLLVVDALPRNEAGKVVKAELRALLTRRDAGRAPRPGPEQRLAALWTRVLGVTDLAADDEFLARGGDSLKAAQLAALAAEEFGVAVPAALVFDRPALAEQAGWLAEQHGPPDAGPVAPEPGHSALQEYFLRWMRETDPPRVVSAIPVALRIDEAVDATALRAALDDLVRRHDALRSSFPGGRVRVAEAARVTLVEAAAPDEAAAGRRVAEHLSRPYDLTEAPLMRAILVRVDRPAGYVLGLAVHHLVFDGWSTGVLLGELARCYDARRRGGACPLPGRAPASLDSYARARARWPAAREFWRTELAGVASGPAWVPGYRDADRYAARAYPITVPGVLADRVREAAHERGATPFMAVLAAWATALARWTAEPEVVVMSPVPGRTRPEDAAVIGCLVQSLLLRVPVGDSPGPDELLARVRGIVLRATDHQYYPYEEFSRVVRRPAWLRFEQWAAPAHLAGLASEPFALPRELMYEWPLTPAERGPAAPELALTVQPDGAWTGWLVANDAAMPAGPIGDLSSAFLADLGRFADAAATSPTDLSGARR